MLTLTKRPQPQLGSTTTGIRMTELEYAKAMRERAVMEGHLSSVVTIKPDDAFLDAIAAGNKSTVEIAAYVSCSREHTRKRLLRLEAGGMVSVVRKPTAVWSLKC